LSQVLLNVTKDKKEYDDQHYSKLSLLALRISSNTIITWHLCNASHKHLHTVLKYLRWNVGVKVFLNQKLISRWDSEHELSLQRHRTRTSKCNRQYNTNRKLICDFLL